MTKERDQRKPWRRASDYLLSGLVRCGYCGSSCTGGTDPPAERRRIYWRYYICGNQKRKGWDTCKLGKVGADNLEQAVIENVHDRILTRDYLQGLLEEVRHLFGIEQTRMELAEVREYVRELEQAINGLVDAIERRPSSALLTRLSERERERDEALARTVRLEAKSQRYASIQLDSQTLDTLVTELRNGLRADQATVSETLRRVVVGVEVTKEKGTLDVCVPSAVLSVGTPGGVRTTGPHSTLSFVL